MRLRAWAGGLIGAVSLLGFASACTTDEDTAALSTPETERSMALQKGERATFEPGEVEPGASRVNCRTSAADARPLVARVPALGEGVSLIADGEPGYGVTLIVVTHKDGKVAAVCR
jgi:hypothetical protein